MLLKEYRRKKMKLSKHNEADKTNNFVLMFLRTADYKYQSESVQK